MDPRIGIYDSGIGGLTIAAAIRQALPAERLLYFGDNAHVPYGERTAAEILEFSTAITEALLAKGCRSIVVACNTASSAALNALRAQFPHVPFVGMEPAVKPAAEQTRTGVVGVLATRATVEGKALADVVERFAHGVEVIRQACPGLAAHIDAGHLDEPEAAQLDRTHAGTQHRCAGAGLHALSPGASPDRKNRRARRTCDRTGRRHRAAAGPVATQARAGRTARCTGWFGMLDQR